MRKLLIAALFAVAVPAFAGSHPVERPTHDRHHELKSVERANERQAERQAAVVKAKAMEHTKIDEK